MCTGLEPMALAGLGLAGGTVLSSMMAPKMPTPQIAAPEKPPAPTKQPERAPAAATAGAAPSIGPGASGNGSTFLTGPSGIDTSTLSLGKNTLLGQ